MNRWKNVISKKWKGKSIVVVILLTFSCSVSTALAQEAIPATGGNASGSGGSAGYSVGQFVYHTHTGTDHSVAEGVQQPYEISIVTAVDELDGINLSVSAYPNPASDYLTLRIDAVDISGLSYQLYDMQGKVLQNKKITNNLTSIVMGNLIAADYFVKVFQSNKEVKTFKIIKN